MLKLKKLNILGILSFLILLLLLCYNSYSFIQNRNSIDKSNQQTREFCLQHQDETEQYGDYCKGVLSNGEIQLDFYTTFTNIVVFGYSNISFVLFLFIVMPSLLYLSKCFKSGTIINELTRNSYKKTMLKAIKKAYMSVWIIPSIILISFIICALYTKVFDPAYAIKYGTVAWSESTMSNPILFMILYLLNMIIHSLLYINIGLIVVRKYHNYFVAVILSFLMFIGIEAFLEIAINGILFNSILKSEFGGLFNIMNMLALKDYYGIIPTLSIPFIIAIISFFVVYTLYRNKEKLIIDCETNE